ncbi:GTPase [Mesobacillus maritimus]|uniref:GTPase n=1 Tax=Mesobacillus maritimus TaxID=1643336 RepID=UPI00384E57D9
MDDNNIYESIDAIKEELEKLNQTQVRIALFGQPGSGKSSLINALIGEDVARVSQETDTTISEDPYKWEDLILTDLPGYGTKNFPADSFFERFDVLSYDIFICVFSGKFKQEDTEFFRRLHKENKKCIFVRNSVDSMFEKGKTIEQLKENVTNDVREQVGKDVKVYFTSCRTEEGLDDLTQAIYENLNSVKQIKFSLDAKAYSEDFLEKKKKACYKFIYLGSSLAAANGINPIPLVDITVDLSILTGIFDRIRKSFGLSKEIIEDNKPLYNERLLSIVNNVLKYSTKTAITKLLEKVAKDQLEQQAVKTTLKQIGKRIPLIGQGISATTSFIVTFAASKSYCNDCAEIATAILKDKLYSSTN